MFFELSFKFIVLNGFVGDIIIFEIKIKTKFKIMMIIIISLVLDSNIAFGIAYMFGMVCGIIIAIRITIRNELEYCVALRIFFWSIEAVRINRIINPPTKARNSLNPIQDDKKMVVLIADIMAVSEISLRIIDPGSLQLANIIRIQAMKIKNDILIAN